MGGLAVGASTWSLLLQPNGRVDACAVRRTGDEELLIDVDDGWGDRAAACSAFASGWRRSPDRIDFSVLAVRGARSRRAQARSPRWGVECGYDEVRPVGLGSGDRRRGPVALEAARAAAGWPAMGRRSPSRPSRPSRPAPRRGRQLHQGCYPGQEFVERMHSRGASAPRLVRRLRAVAGPLRAGAPVPSRAARSGTVTSTAAGSHWRSSAGRSSRGPRCRSGAPRRPCSRSADPDGPPDGAVKAHRYSAQWPPTWTASSTRTGPGPLTTRVRCRPRGIGPAAPRPAHSPMPCARPVGRVALAVIAEIKRRSPSRGALNPISIPRRSRGPIRPVAPRRCPS